LPSSRLIGSMFWHNLSSIRDQRQPWPFLISRHFLTVLQDFGCRMFLGCFLLFEPLIFQWHFQCFEGILRENGVIIGSSFDRKCDSQFKALNLKSSFPIQKLSFFNGLRQFMIGKYFYWLWTQFYQCRQARLVGTPGYFGRPVTLATLDPGDHYRC
jgi:hypothetical protein